MFSSMSGTKYFFIFDSVDLILKISRPKLIISRIFLNSSIDWYI